MQNLSGIPNQAIYTVSTVFCGNCLGKWSHFIRSLWIFYIQKKVIFPVTFFTEDSALFQERLFGGGWVFSEDIFSVAYLTQMNIGTRFLTFIFYLLSPLPTMLSKMLNHHQQCLSSLDTTCMHVSSLSLALKNFLPNMTFLSAL